MAEALILRRKLVLSVGVSGDGSSVDLRDLHRSANRFFLVHAFRQHKWCG